jgi:hypothetical protein
MDFLVSFLSWAIVVAAILVVSTLAAILSTRLYHVGVGYTLVVQDMMETKPKVEERLTKVENRWFLVKPIVQSVNECRINNKRYECVPATVTSTETSKSVRRKTGLDSKSTPLQFCIYPTR